MAGEAPDTLVVVSHPATFTLGRHAPEGDVLLESVYRFKGQAAPAVIFAEIDFDELDDKAVRKLFVGATRSMMRLTLILHEKAAAKLLERIG